MQITKIDSINSSLVIPQNEELCKIEKMIQQNIVKIQKEFPDVKITYYHSSVCKVFTHADFPDKIFKLMELNQAKARLENVTFAKEVLSQNALNYCHVPQTEMMKIQHHDESLGLIIAEFVKGTDMTTKEKFLFFSSEEPEDKKLIRELIRQQAEFICKVGYWDYSENNVIQLPDFQGFSFIDHEHTYPDPLRIAQGLTSLMEACPIDLIDMVVNIGKQHGTTISQAGETARNKKIKSSEIHLKALEFFRKMNIATVNQPINTETWAGMELDILNILNSTRENQHQEELFTAQQRCHKWQPLIEENISFSEFEQALENLKIGGAIHTWERNTLEQDLSCRYTLYF